MIKEFVIAPQQGHSFKLLKNQKLKVIDPCGQQVSDFFCFAANNRFNALSSGKSIDYNDSINFTSGHALYANSGEVMCKIIEDSCKRNDFLVTPCSQQMFEMISGKNEFHPSCLENLTKAFHQFDIPPALITTTFNIFMNVQWQPSGKISVEAPLSKAGDYLILQAEMDLIVGLTACSDEGTNNGKCKPIKYEIY